MSTKKVIDWATVPDIYRGTTPTVTVSVNGVDLSDATQWPTVIVTMRNFGKVTDFARDALTIEKTEAGCSVTMTLTQEQTLRMTAMKPVEVQVRAKDKDGVAIASDVTPIDVQQVIKDGEI